MMIVLLLETATGVASRSRTVVAVLEQLQFLVEIKSDLWKRCNNRLLFYTGVGDQCPLWVALFLPLPSTFNIQRVTREVFWWTDFFLVYSRSRVDLTDCCCMDTVRDNGCFYYSHVFLRLNNNEILQLVMLL
jgi:hypothetical protein